MILPGSKNRKELLLKPDLRGQTEIYCYCSKEIFAQIQPILSKYFSVVERSDDFTECPVCGCNANMCHGESAHDITVDGIELSSYTCTMCCEDFFIFW